MRRLAVSLILSLALLGSFAGPVAPTARAADCGFVLGFATLAAMIPGPVGQCLENERHNPENGDGLQSTTGGLLVWRKADNFTAFTDGFRTWVNGPFGAQQRLNSQRFFWEANPDRLAVVPSPRPLERCHTAGLGLSVDNVDAGAGNRVGTFRFVNTQPVACTFYGFPGAQLLDATNDPLPTNVVRNGGWFSGLAGPSQVVVPAGGSAIFRFHWGVIITGSETSCPTADRVAVTPPDEYAPIVVPVEITACNAGRLDVTPVLAE